MKLQEHLENSIKNEPVNESVLLAGFIASAFLATALKGIGNSDFMKTISPGVNALLGGVGSLFGGFGLLAGGLGARSVPSMNPDDLDELLKKDPDDMTGVEKKKLREISKSKKYKEQLSNNQIKKLNACISTLDSAEGNEPEGEEDKDTTASEYTPEMMAGLMAMAKKANDEEKDKTKKAENDAMLDMLAACSYDKDGNEIPMEERLEKMKGIVGDDKWESFKADISKKFDEVKDNEDFLKAAEKARENLSKEDAESFIESTKERAKTTLEKVEKEKKEQAEIDKDIEDLQAEIDKEKQNSVFKPEENEKLKELVDKLKKRQEDREKLAKNSIAGQAAPEAVTQSIEIQKKTEEYEAAKRDHDAQKEKVDRLKAELEAIEDKESQEYKDKKQELETETARQNELKSKMDNAERAKNDAIGGGNEPKNNNEPKMTDNSVSIVDSDGDTTGEKIVKKEDGTYKKVDAQGNETDATEEDFNNAKNDFESYVDADNEEEDVNADKDLDDTYQETDDEKESEEGKSSERDETKKRINPAQKWHKKKKKNGAGTTKNYYDKDGNSISPEEFKQKMVNYKNYVSRHKKNSDTPTPQNSSLYTKLKNYLIENLQY